MRRNQKDNETVTPDALDKIQYEGIVYVTEILNGRPAYLIANRHRIDGTNQVFVEMPRVVGYGSRIPIDLTVLPGTQEPYVPGNFDVRTKLTRKGKIKFKIRNPDDKLSDKLRDLWYLMAHFRRKKKVAVFDPVVERKMNNRKVKDPEYILNID